MRRPGRSPPFHQRRLARPGRPRRQLPLRPRFQAPAASLAQRAPPPAPRRPPRPASPRWRPRGQSQSDCPGRWAALAGPGRQRPRRPPRLDSRARQRWAPLPAARERAQPCTPGRRPRQRSARWRLQSRSGCTSGRPPVRASPGRPGPGAVRRSLARPWAADCLPARPGLARAPGARARPSGGSGAPPCSRASPRPQRSPPKEARPAGLPMDNLPWRPHARAPPGARPAARTCSSRPRTLPAAYAAGERLRRLRQSPRAAAAQQTRRRLQKSSQPKSWSAARPTVGAPGRRPRLRARPTGLPAQPQRPAAPTAPAAPSARAARSRRPHARRRALPRLPRRRGRRRARQPDDPPASKSCPPAQQRRIRPCARAAAAAGCRAAPPPGPIHPRWLRRSARRAPRGPPASRGRPPHRTRTPR